MSQTTIKKPDHKTSESPAPINDAQLEVVYHFPCPIYLINRPDFLEAVNLISEEALQVASKDTDLNEMYPVQMTNHYFDDPRIADFTEFVGATAWGILSEQGYAMSDMAVSFTAMWTQEHHKHSSMDAHVHGFGSQVVGFYFLETPENCSRVVFHDPRAGKVQIDLPEQDISKASPASRMINFEPKPGMMIFANSWLAHSFTRHATELSIKFVHFNLTVIPQPQICLAPAAEII